jgi:hypothetical protein
MCVPHRSESVKNIGTLADSHLSSSRLFDRAPKGHKTIEQGVSTPVQLAIGDIKGVTGEFWRDGKVAPW